MHKKVNMNEIEVLRRKNEDLIDRSKKKINDLTQRINELESKENNKELYQAIFKAKQEIIVKKNGKASINKGFSYKYFKLEDILEEVDRTFPKYELLLLQPPSSDGTSIETQIVHVPTGQKTKPSRLKIFPTDSRNKAQAYGGGVTYSRRYSLTSFFGIAAEPDTDGN